MHAFDPDADGAAAGAVAGVAGDAVSGGIAFPVAERASAPRPTPWPSGRRPACCAAAAWLCRAPPRPPAGRPGRGRRCARGEELKRLLLDLFERDKYLSVKEINGACPTRKSTAFAPRVTARPGRARASHDFFCGARHAEHAARRS